MRIFIHDDFLLRNETGQRLYHEIAKELPLIDFHNHINVSQLARGYSFENLAQLGVIPDQYKHRAMRVGGIPEAGITGKASDKEKFLNWATIYPKTLGSPLFHWNALELKRIFDIDELLNPGNAEKIWSQVNEQLAGNAFSAVGLLKKWNIEWLSTSDDLLDDLEVHLQATTRSGIKITPSLRGDSILAFESDHFDRWLEKLTVATDASIKNLNDYLKALRSKLTVFQEAGCQFADHALDAGFTFRMVSEEKASSLFQKRLAGGRLMPSELTELKSWMLVHLAGEYNERQWALQLHVGAQRHTSSRLRRLAGGAGGYAAIGQAADIHSLVQLLDNLEQQNSLPKIVLYTLNPTDNEAFASLTGSFAEDGVAGKIQFGPAWWYNDHYEGIRNHLQTLSNYGFLCHFIGMTTDSRSLLSFSRHEYFRRILCDLLGEWVESGLLPPDDELLAETVRAVCYGNIKNWITTKNKIHINETI